MEHLQTEFSTLNVILIASDVKLRPPPRPLLLTSHLALVLPKFYNQLTLAIVRHGLNHPPPPPVSKPDL